MKLEVLEYEGKNLEEVKAKALAELNISENDILYKSDIKKGKLFKSDTVSLKILKIKDVAEYIKNNLKELVTNMGIDLKLECNVRENQINIKMYSDKNNILIGKNGQTLIAIQNILKQQIYNIIGTYPYILLDVENYKEKRNINLERMAKKTAREVIKTKIDVILDDMNSYERRIIHNALSDFKNISTVSEGEEPNRHIVIRYKETKED